MRTHLAFVIPFLIVLMLIFSTWAGAKSMDDEAGLKRLVSDTTWQLPNLTGMPGDEFWDFNGDGTMCFRLGGDQGSPCTDHGKWRIEGAMLCWKLSWFGSTSGLQAPCVQINDLGSGHYELVATGDLKKHWDKRPFKVLPR